MLPLVPFVLLHSVVAADPTHLNPGALSAPLGRVSLGEDVLWVRYPFTALVNMPGRLRTIMEQVTELVLQLDRNAREEGVTCIMHELLRYLNETPNIALDNYADLSFFNRTKRGLINGLGQLSSMLFGTAMNEDVEDLRERYNHLASLAANRIKAIYMNSLRIDRLDHAVQDIASYFRTLGTALNAVIEEVESLHEVALIY